MPRYCELTTGWHPDRVDEVAADAGGRGAARPVDAKRLLARTVVDLYHGEGAGAGPRRSSTGCSSPTRRPSEIAEFAVAPDDVAATAGAPRPGARPGLPGAVPSNKEGRRKIEQGGVRLDGEVVGIPTSS